MRTSSGGRRTSRASGISSRWALYDGLRGLPPGRRLLLMVDELPVFVKRLLDADRARAERFLAWFWMVRQARPERDEPVRWLLAGSIGLAPLTEREGWPHLINDLSTVSLGELTPDAARDLLDGLAVTHRVALEEAERDALLHRLGWALPYFLQLAFARLRQQAAGPDRVDRVFAGLCGADAAKDFAPWWSRLAKELGAVRGAAAESVLDGCAADPAGVSRDGVRERARRDR